MTSLSLLAGRTVDFSSTLFFINILFINCCVLGNFTSFLLPVDFFKNIFFNYNPSRILSECNIMDSDKAGHLAWNDLGPNSKSCTQTN